MGAFTWPLPSNLLRELGIAPADRRRFLVADGRRIEMEYGQGEAPPLLGPAPWRVWPWRWTPRPNGWSPPIRSCTRSKALSLAVSAMPEERGPPAQTGYSRGCGGAH